MKGVTRNIAIFLFVAMVSSLATGCSLAPIHGYFHQVTVIRGRVVGRSLGPFQFRWLRQSFGVAAAQLALYEYRWPARIEDPKLVTAIKTDPHGDFDFGSIPKSHYVLDITVEHSGVYGGFFEVEVTDTVRTTRSITIDVSPIHPDCTGGHEFIESKS